MCLGLKEGPLGGDGRKRYSPLCQLHSLETLLLRDVFTIKGAVSTSDFPKSGFDCKGKYKKGFPFPRGTLLLDRESKSMEVDRGGLTD